MYISVTLTNNCAVHLYLQPDGELAPDEQPMGFNFDPSASLPSDGQFKF